MLLKLPSLVRSTETVFWYGSEDIFIIIIMERELTLIKGFFLSGLNFGLERDLLKSVGFSFIWGETIDSIERAKLLGLKLLGFFL